MHYENIKRVCYVAAVSLALPMNPGKVPSDKHSANLFITGFLSRQ
jgi:hypothetical protein